VTFSKRIPLFLGTAALLACVAMPATAAAKPTEVNLEKSRYGKVLFDGKQRALYLFTKDGTGDSQCYGACATAWPPFYAKGKLKGGPGVNQSMLGTTTRTDGRRQVTYAGKPLYYYITDKDPLEITCHNVDEFGGIWYVLGRNGAPA